MSHDEENGSPLGFLLSVLVFAALYLGGFLPTPRPGGS
jgi:hypothetical protein